MKGTYHIMLLVIFLIIISTGVAVLTSGKATITGNITAVKDFFTKPTAYTYFIMSLIAAGIVFNIIYVSFAGTDEARMKRLISQARKHTKKGDNDKATAAYEEARPLYSKLGAIDKMRHYDSIMNVYNELLASSRAQEAKTLADKYAAGEITKEELQRLEMILKGY